MIVPRNKKRPTQRHTLKEIRTVLGLTANVVDREYRINYRLHDPRYRPTPKDGAGGTIYFTNDAQDALDTARVMARVKRGGRLFPPAADEITTLEGSDVHVEVIPLTSESVEKGEQ